MSSEQKFANNSSTKKSEEDSSANDVKTEVHEVGTKKSGEHNKEFPLKRARSLEEDDPQALSCKTPKLEHDQNTQSSDYAAETKNSSAMAQDAVNILNPLGIEAGARIQVQWEVHYEDIVNSVITPRTQTRWWSATLLQHDGRTHTLEDDAGNGQGSKDKVVIDVHQLDYDPYPEGGFVDRSIEEVCFLTDHSLLNMNSDTRAFWRKEGDTWEPPLNMDDEEEQIMTEPATRAEQNDVIPLQGNSVEDVIRTMLDTVLQTALVKSGISTKMQEMSASQKLFVAEKVSGAKEKLIQKMLEQLDESSDVGNNSFSGLITPEHVRRCMEEVGKDLNM